MYSRLLDAKTLGAVVAKSPRVRARPEELARDLIKVLKEETVQPRLSRRVEVDETYFELSYKDLAGLLPFEISPNQVGLALREMGLTKIRFSDGYRLYWNEDQLHILMDVLEVL